MKLKIYLLAITLYGCSVCLAQQNKEPNTSLDSLYEIDVNVLVPFEESFYYIKALLGDSESTIFFSFYEIVNVLEIPIERKGNLMSVHYKKFEAPYIFDFLKKRIIINKKEYKINTNDFIISEEGIEYVKPEFFERLGITLNYSKKDISAVIETKEKSPKEIRLMRAKSLKSSIHNSGSKMKKLDTIFSDNQHVEYQFSSLNYNIAINNLLENSTRASVNLSTNHILFGGNLNLGSNLSINQPEGNLVRNTFFNWKNNYNTKFIRNVEIGTFGNLGTVHFNENNNKRYGVIFSNKGRYTRTYKEQKISGYISPNTPIELYAGQELIDYQFTDENGFYSFNHTPEHFKSSITLRYIDELGNPVRIEKNLGLLLRQNEKKQLTYKSFFSFSDKDINNGLKIDYGITRNITSFIGLDNSVDFDTQKSTIVPYTGLYTSFFKNKFMMDVTYQHNSLLNLNYQINANKLGSFRGRYVKFFTENTIENNPSQKEVLSINYQKAARIFNRLSLFLRVQNETVKTDVFQNTTNANLELNASFSKYRFRYSNNLGIRSFSNGITSNRSTFNLETTLFKSLKTKVQYSVDAKNKKMKQGFLDIQYQKSPNFSMNFSANYLHASKKVSGMISLKYNLSSILVRNNLSYANDSFTNSNTLSGSYIPGQKSQGTQSKFKTGGTGALLIPFLDKNNNGIKDSNEPMVKGLNIHITSGSQKEVLQDGSIYIHNMKAGLVESIKLNQENVQNIYHQLSYTSIGVKASLGKYTTVVLPFKEVGEIEGYVSLSKEIKNPTKVSIYNMNHQKVTTMDVESDGYFSYLGLFPGKYYLKVDTSEANTDYVNTPFELFPNSKNGAYLGGLQVRFK